MKSRSVKSWLNWNEAMHFSPQELKDMFGTMVLIRQFELSTIEIFAQRMRAGDFPGALHSSEGQEAIAVGVMSRLRPDDYVFSTYRGHGHAIAKGIPLERVAAEVHGRATGASRGFGGSMHLFWKPLNFMGGNGIVGGGIPLALGTAYAAVKRGTDQVTAVFFGDGAASQGSFHESLNMAALKRWPVIFVCENNLYAATTHVSGNCPLENIADRAAAYGIPGVVADGNDLLAVADTAETAVARARSGPRADADRVQDLSPPGALHGDPRASAQSGTDRLAPARSDRTASPPGSWPRASPIRPSSTTSAVRPQQRLEQALQFMRESPLPQPTDVEEVLYAP